MGIEAFRGLNPYEPYLNVAVFRATLEPGASLTLVASAEAHPSLDGSSAYTQRRAYEEERLGEADPALVQAPPEVRHLVLAADQFIVRRALPDDPDGRSVIAGYPWFSDWGRDTMISLPGLTLATRRFDIARRILRTYAHFADQGMLPNRFPDAGAAPEYNTVDATLWYFEAIRAYHRATGDAALLEELYPVLASIIAWHHRGTRYNIHVDPTDSLLYAGEAGVQLTWMDAKVGEWVVTPRTGKAVEINALWYNALRIMAEFAQVLGRPQTKSEYTAQAEQVRVKLRTVLEPGHGLLLRRHRWPKRQRPRPAPEPTPGRLPSPQPPGPCATARGRRYLRSSAANLARFAQLDARPPRLSRQLRRRPAPARWRLSPGNRVGLADRPLRQRPSPRLSRPCPGSFLPCSSAPTPG